MLQPSSPFDDGHADVSGRHRGELLADSAGDDRRVDDAAIRDFIRRAKKDVRCEKGLGDGEGAVDRVVERAVEPLDAPGQKRFLVDHHQVLRE